VEWPVFVLKEQAASANPTDRTINTNAGFFTRC
jgi:hypothetical protein